MESRHDVVASENGALVLRVREIKEATERAIGIQNAKKVSLARVANGEYLPDINGTNGRIQDVKAEQKR
jgi:hypothetical protein